MKKTKLSIAAVSVAGLLALGAAAAGVHTITAELRPDVTVKVNGQTQAMLDKNGDVVYPIQYNGTTYLPVRALGDTLGNDVRWDSATQTIYLTTRTDGQDGAVLAFSELEDRMTALEKEIKALSPASDYTGRAKQYAAFSDRLDALDDAVGRAEDAALQDYRDGKISYDEYAKRRDRADRLDTRLDEAFAALEKKTIANESGYQTAAQQAAAALDTLESKIKAAERKIADLKPASTYDGRVKQYRELDAELAALSDSVRTQSRALNDNLRGGLLTYREYNPLNERAGKLDVRLKDARATLERKTISKDEAQGPQAGGQQYADYVALLDKAETRVASLEKEVKDAQSSAYRALLGNIDALDDELDALDDAIERSYRAGKLTAAQYRTLDQRADGLEDRLEHMEDQLDSWYDHDDDDDDDDD